MVETKQNEVSKGTFNTPLELAEKDRVQPIVFMNGGKRYKLSVSKHGYSGESSKGVPWKSNKIRLSIAQIDGEGEVQNDSKSSIGIPAEVETAVLEKFFKNILAVKDKPLVPQTQG